MEKRRIIVIHGFLGLPSDWDKLPWGADVDVESVDLWKWIKTNAARFSLSSEKDAFNFFAQDFLNALSLRKGQSKPTLVGYSLGGRLAMHILLKDPSCFSEAVFISAHPGLDDSDQPARALRQQQDANWARKFSSVKWTELMDEWNSQEVLSSSQESERLMPRHEASFDRTALSWAMLNWSLALQRDLKEQLSLVSVPVQWICGERDKKFVKILSDLVRPRSQRLNIVQGAGHRTPWDRPEIISHLIESAVC